MSCFYCEWHHEVEDSDFVGYEVKVLDEGVTTYKVKEYCEDGWAEIQAEEEAELQQEKEDAEK